MLDETKPVWILKDARPYGPFSICLVGRDHVIVKAPYDKRLWVDAHRVKEEKFIRREIFPISCVTQDENDAIAWRERNEPKIGDLVSIVYQEYISMSSQIRGVPPVREIRYTTVEGIVGACTLHQIRLFSPGALVQQKGLLRAHGKTNLGRHASKDACIVLSRDESTQAQQKPEKRKRKSKN